MGRSLRPVDAVCGGLSVSASVLNRLAAQCGQSVHLQDSVQHAFPEPEDILRLHENAFREMGFSYSKARYLIAASQTAAGGQLNAEQLEQLDDSAVLQKLLNLHFHLLLDGLAQAGTISLETGSDFKDF